MIRRFLLCVALAAALPLSAAAQQVTLPKPTPDLQTYDDPAMHFRAPANYVPIGQRKLPLNALTTDAQIVAAWAVPDPTRPKRILIEQESYEQNLNGFDDVFEQQMRTQFSGVTFRDKQHTTLKNGMPALYMTAVWGTGFYATKAYMYIWVDGQRGVALISMAQVGEISDQTARAQLADCTAVAYPAGRDY